MAGARARGGRGRWERRANGGAPAGPRFHRDSRRAARGRFHAEGAVPACDVREGVGAGREGPGHKCLGRQSIERVASQGHHSNFAMLSIEVFVLDRLRPVD